MGFLGRIFGRKQSGETEASDNDQGQTRAPSRRRGFSFQLASLESKIVFRKVPSQLRANAIRSFKAPASASDYVILADEEHNIGEAWFCLDPTSGRIYRVDPEYGTGFELVNTSMDGLQQCMEAAVGWSAKHPTAEIGQHPEIIEELATRLTAIDATAFGVEDSFWAGLVDYMRDCAGEYDGEMKLWFR